MMTKDDNKPLTLKQNVIWNSIGCTIYQGCVWLITFLVVILSESYENSGILALAMAIGNLFFPLATYNIRTFQVSDVKGEFTSGNYVAFRFVSVTFALIVFVVYSYFTCSTNAIFVSVICWLLFKMDESFCNVFYGIDQRYSRMDYIGISQTVRGFALLVTFSLGLRIFGSLNISFIFMFVSCLLVTLFFDIPKASMLDSIKPSLNISEFCNLAKKCLPLVCTLLMFGAVVSISRQLFEFAYGTELLGIYAAVATPTAIVQVAAQYLYSPILVTIAERVKENDVNRAISAILKTYLFIGFVSALILIGAVFFGDWFLRLVYGNSVADYTYVLTYAVIASASSAFMGFTLDLLIVLRKLWPACLINVLSFVISILLTLPLCGYLGMNGINISIMISFAFGIIIGILFVRNKILYGGVCG